MSIVLVRVDERLMHGQVVLGWGVKLGVERYAVADPDLASADWEQDLYRMGVPDGIAVDFVTAEQAAGAVDGWTESSTRTAFLTRGIPAILELASVGALDGLVVNLGGLHHAPGRRQVLPFLHLDPDDLAGLRELRGRGIEVVAQELPDAPRCRGDELVRRGERAWSG